MSDECWHTSAEAIDRTGSGWLRPDGTLMACRLQQHLDCLADDVLHGAAVRELQAAGRRLGVPGAARLRGAWDDHCMDMSRFMDGLFDRGWVRLGLAGRGASRILEAEGGPDGLRAAWERVEDLAALLDISDIRTVGLPCAVERPAMRAR